MSDFVIFLQNVISLKPIEEFNKNFSQYILISKKDAVRIKNVQIEKSGITTHPGHALIFSARSATSIFLEQILNAAKVPTTCLSTSQWTNYELTKIGISHIKNINTFKGQCDYIFDPFFDINMEKALNFLKFNGTYVTCGLQAQYQEHSHANSYLNLKQAITTAIIKNQKIIGNCLGSTKNLKSGMEFFEKNKIHPIIDSSWDIYSGIEFIKRSFFDKNRLGKTVLFLSPK